MAQDTGQDNVLNTHALDMATLPGGSVSSEMEADMIAEKLKKLITTSSAKRRRILRPKRVVV